MPKTEIKYPHPITFWIDNETMDLINSAQLITEDVPRANILRKTLKSGLKQYNEEKK